MKDRDFLIWIHERLTHVHGENELMGYMHRFRAIIRTVDKNQETDQSRGQNSLDKLKKELKNDDIDEYEDFGT